MEFYVSALPITGRAPCLPAQWSKSLKSLKPSHTVSGMLWYMDAKRKPLQLGGDVSGSKRARGGITAIIVSLVGLRFWLDTAPPRCFWLYRVRTCKRKAAKPKGRKNVPGNFAVGTLWVWMLKPSEAL